MKNLTKRIISTMLCAAVTAVNVGIGGIIPSVSVTADAAGTQSIFDDRANTVLGSSAEDIAIKKADPYGTADNNGNGKKWAALTVVPEVYATAADGKGYAVDYHSNGTADTSGSSLDGMFFMQATAGLNLGNGKDSAVARLSLSTAAGGDGGLYLTICDPVNGGWLTDGNVTCIGTVSHNGGTPYQTQNFTGKSLTSSNSHAITYDAYAVSKRINYFSSVNNNVKGQYMAIAKGDFDGDGSDSIIVYVPEYKAPKIQEFGYTKRNVSELNGESTGTVSSNDYYTYTWAYSGANYYRPFASRTISSNVYTDFGLDYYEASESEKMTRNVPIVDIVAADVDRDGCDELIVTAGLGGTTTGNNCNTVMKIYDLVNGTFRESYTKSLSGTYNGQQGRIRWASSAVGNVVAGANLGLGVDFPEIVTAGWVDVKTTAGMSMKKRFGVHITELSGLTEKNGTYVGTYQERTVLGTSESTIKSAGSDGVSAHMKDGFTTDWTRHEKLAVSTLAYKGTAAASALMLGDTVYDITSENTLSAVYWSKDITDHTRYNVRKMLTGYYTMAPQAVAVGGSQTTVPGIPVNESAYFLCADVNNTYAAYAYYYSNGTWTTTRVGTNVITEKPANTNTVDICNVDVDDDSVYIKLNKVTKVWTDPKPLYVLEAAPYFSEFPDSRGTTTIGHATESGSEFSWNAGVYSSVELYGKQSATVIAKLVEVQAGTNLSASLTYQGSKSTSQTVEVDISNYSVDNQVIVERTPMYVYSYDVMGYQDSEAFNVSVAGKPSMTAISVEDYNTLAQNFNNKLGSNEQEKKVKLIGSNFGLGTPGDPMTYRKSFPSTELSGSGDGLTNYYGSEGSTQKTISKSTTTNNGYDIQISNDRYAGAEVLGIGVKFTFGIAAGTGGTFFDTDSISCTGEVARQNKDSRFDFKWDVARWITDGIPVVGYKVEMDENDIRNLPPVAPSELTITGKGNNSASLKWTDPSTTNGRMTANYINVYYKKDSDLNYSSKQVQIGGTAGEHSWSLTGLARNTKYQCYITNTFVRNDGTQNESFESNVIEFTTNNDKEAVDVTINAGKGLKLQSGTATQSVDKGLEAITPVIYNVLNGYQIPSGFYRSSNGIEAQSAGIDIIKVSGTPTANTTINIGDMSLINYSISYHLNNGTLSNPVNSYTIESDTITIPKPVRAGYVFDGWTDAYGNKITEIKTGSTGNVTLTANWKSLGALGYTDNYHADGSEQYPYIISSKSGWDFFCDCLEDTANFNGFSGKYIQLKNNITVSKMAGSGSHDFCGHFDGCGNTITFTATAADNYAAPFRYVKGTANSPVTFKNINAVTKITANDYRHVAGLIAVHTGNVNIENCNIQVNISDSKGTNNPADLYPAGLVSQSAGTLNIKGCKVTGEIATDGKYAGGFIGIQQGDVTIENGMSSVTINSSTVGDGTHGGFVAGHAKGTLIIRGCVFNGKMLGKNTNSCGGFIGWRYGGSEIYNSIFAPVEITVSTANSATFGRNKVDTYNSYYTYLFNDGTTYAPYLSDGNKNPKLYNNGQQAYTVTAGNNVTIDYGTPKNTYDISGITAYETGLAYNGKFYAGKDDEIALNLGYNKHQGYKFNGYTAGEATLAESESNYTLTMPDGNVTVSAVETETAPLANNSEISTNEIVLGNSVTINAKADGGEGDYTYAVLYKKKADTKWTVKQNYSTVDTITVKPAKATDYDICVKVQDSTGNIVKKFFTVKVNAKLVNASTLSAENIVLGQKITANCSATGGIGKYQYQVVYKQTSQTKWTTAQNFGENATVTFKPAKATTYDVCVKAKDENGTIIKKFFTVHVNANLANTSTISATEITKGSTVTVNGSATGGVGNYTYAVYYKQKTQTKWTTKQDFNKNSVISVKPAQATDYDICIKIRDDNGTVAKKYFTVTVK